MLKKMVKKRDLSKSNVIKKNMFYTPISTRYTSLVSEHSLKTENTKSTTCLGYSKRIGNSITDCGQFKMKNNGTTFESTKDLTSLRDESSIIRNRKKSVNSVKSSYNNNVSITLSQSSIRRKSSKQVIRSMTSSNQVKMNEDNYKLTNYAMIKTLIQREFVLLRQKRTSSTKNIHPIQRKDTIIHMNTISNRNSIPYTSKKIIFPCSMDKQKNVNEITNELYTQIFEGLFKVIAIYPNVIDRNYISFNQLQYMNVCFLKPFFEILFKSNLTIQKDTFIQMCNIIYSNLTYEEKKQFIYSNRIFFKKYI